MKQPYSTVCRESFVSYLEKLFLYDSESDAVSSNDRQKREQSCYYAAAYGASDHLQAKHLTNLMISGTTRHSLLEVTQWAKCACIFDDEQTQNLCNKEFVSALILLLQSFSLSTHKLVANVSLQAADQ